MPADIRRRPTAKLHCAHRRCYRPCDDRCSGSSPRGHQPYGNSPQRRRPVPGRATAWPAQARRGSQVTHHLPHPVVKLRLILAYEVKETTGGRTHHQMPIVDDPGVPVTTTAPGGRLLLPSVRAVASVTLHAWKGTLCSHCCAAPTERLRHALRRPARVRRPWAGRRFALGGSLPGVGRRCRRAT